MSRGVSHIESCFDSLFPLGFLQNGGARSMSCNSSGSDSLDDDGRGGGGSSGSLGGDDIIVILFSDESPITLNNFWLNETNWLSIHIQQ